MLTKTRRRILFYSSIFVFFVAAIPILLYSFGYGISRDFKISKTGGIFIQTSEAGADVFVGSKHKRTSLLGKSGLIKNLVPGIYKVSVRKEGFWDWEKSLDVFSETVTARRVLLVPRNQSGKILGTTTPQIKKTKPPYASIKKFWAIPKTEDFIILGEDKKFYKNKESFDIYQEFGTTTAEILLSKRESIFDETFSRVIYWDKNSINSYWFADLDQMPQWEKQLKIGDLEPRATKLFQTNKAIRAVAQYPGWPDWLIIAVSDGVWATEMDSYGGEKSFPLFQGKEPKIISIESEQSIIFDDGNYLEIFLPS